MATEQLLKDLELTIRRVTRDIRSKKGAVGGDKLSDLAKLVNSYSRLQEREKDEAYLSARPGRQYTLFFTDGGSVRLNLKKHRGNYELRWVNISTGEWGNSGRLQGGQSAVVSAPGKGPWVAVIIAAAD